MKKVLMICIVFLVILLTIGSASAWHRHPYSNLRLFIGPPVVWVPPPVYYRGYYPPYDYVGPGYYEYGYRVWVPGYWEERWTPYGWERVWIPGYWEYRR
jgi:hypothetical protein